MPITTAHMATCNICCEPLLYLVVNGKTVYCVFLLEKELTLIVYNTRMICLHDRTSFIGNRKWYKACQDITNVKRIETVFYMKMAGSHRKIAANMISMLKLVKISCILQECVRQNNVAEQDLKTEAFTLLPSCKSIPQGLSRPGSPGLRRTERVMHAHT